MTAATTASGRVCVGAIAGAFGTRGEARVKSFCATPEDIARYGELWTEDGRRSFTLRLTRPVAGGFGARLSGVATKDDADALRGTTLWAERARLPSLPDDEFYHADLIGLDVVDTGGVRLGTLRAIHNHGAGDVLEIAAGAGSTVPRMSRARPPGASPVAAGPESTPAEDSVVQGSGEEGAAGAAPSGRTLLLPFTRAVVPTVDLAARRVVVDLPEESE